MRIDALRRVPVAAWIVLAVLTALAVGWFARGLLAPITSTHSVREDIPEYPLISPFLYLELPESTDPMLTRLKATLESRIKSEQKDGTLKDAAVYVRDMDSGQWVGVNQDAKYALASMLKVVTVMSVVHEGEQHPGSLAERLTIGAIAPADRIPQAYMPPAHPVQLGQTYTLNQLFANDIVESDNVAEHALESYIGADALRATFAEMNLPLASSTDTDVDTPREYSHLFRVLYSATYLSRESSNGLLTLLSRTTFTDGLVAGVPAGTTVAHKFGENFVPASDAPDAPMWHELHDCGIVYYPEHPYFVCVTTKGDDFPTLAGVIKRISADVWSGMDFYHHSR